MSCQFSLAQTDSTHSAHKASVYSAILPGAGQVYNKKYWKVPIIYAGIGSSIYFAVDNQNKWSQYRDAYNERKNGETDPYAEVYTDSQLITIMDYYERNRDLSYILAAAVYLLNIVDASVDAHLFDFEVNENLSLQIRPSYLEQAKHVQSGLSFQLNF